MLPPEQGVETTASGLLKIPASSGQIPAVILTHGCGSISSGELGWETQLNMMGMATFLVHSFGSRQIPEVCSGQHQINIASVLADAYGALGVLAAHPRIDPSRIAIMGLSFGGRTALWVGQKRFQERYGTDTNRFAA